MGCGASKGTEAVAQPAISSPPVSKPEFTPEDKPRPVVEQEDVAKTKESRDAATKRVDDIVRTGITDFDDDTDTAQDKVYAVEPFQVAPVAAVPPPPVTPPAEPKKPLFQTADTTNTFDDRPAEEAEDTSYFPQQVSLNVGGAAGRVGSGEDCRPSQQQLPPPLPVQTGLQRFDTEELPADTVLPAASQRTPPPAPLHGASASSRQLQPLPSLQQQPASSMQRGQGGQPLMESGPGPTSTQGSGGAPPVSGDPWSSLQSTYRIRETQAAARPDSARSRTGGSREGTGREMLVLGDDDDDFGGGPLSGTMNSTMNRTSGMGTRQPVSLPPPKFGSAPKKGGWGSGAMAQAGELMLGEDDWLVNDRPPGMSAGPALPPLRQAAQQQQAVMSYDSRVRMVPEEPEERRAPVQLKAPAASKSKPTDDVMCEDVEDVDTLLEDEMQKQGLSNKSLAGKLAAYEAQFKDDDD